MEQSYPDLRYVIRYENKNLLQFIKYAPKLSKHDQQGFILWNSELILYLESKID